MQGSESPRKLACSERGLIEIAIESISTHDMACALKSLGGAISLYEQQPSEAIAQRSRLREVLILIRIARNLSAADRRADDDDFAMLEARAEALQSPLH